MKESRKSCATAEAGNYSAVEAAEGLEELHRIRALVGLDVVVKPVVKKPSTDENNRKGTGNLLLCSHFLQENLWQTSTDNWYWQFALAVVTVHRISPLDRLPLDTSRSCKSRLPMSPNTATNGHKSERSSYIIELTQAQYASAAFGLMALALTQCMWK